MAGRNPLVAPVLGHHLNAPHPASGIPPAVEALVGHVFARPDLLREALTHRSAIVSRRNARGKQVRGTGAGSNERLEFVGDRVLGLLIAEWLAERYPAEQEGRLGARLSILVSEPVLFAIADRIGLPDLLSVAEGESRAGVRRLPSVLADAIEALLGALYMDGGLDAARGFVRRAWAEAIETQAEPPKDSKTALQEWLLATRAAVAGIRPDLARGTAARPAFRGRGAGRRGRGERGRLVQARRRTARGRGSARGADGMTTRCGFAAIVGTPNAGKSTLLNRLTGAKLSIVSPKAQTTRFRVLGILMQGEAQILLVDTPGIFKPKRKLDRAMVAAAWVGAQDSDLVVFLVDAKTGVTEGVREIAGKLSGRVWLVLNKIDLVERGRLLPTIADLSKRATFEETYMVSASTGDGVEEFQAALAAAMPPGPYLYPPDDLTDLPDRLLAAEIVREQIFLQTHEEVPYGTTVETESFTERPDGSVRIDATIYVARAGHKAILIGAGGSRIREIGAKARGQLAHLLERTVHLFLNVKERAGWDEEGARLRAIGLDDKV